MSNLLALAFCTQKKLFSLFFKNSKVQGWLRLFLLIPLFSFSPSEALADSWKNLAQGDHTAQEFLGKVDEKKIKAGPHPFYDGQQAKESSYSITDLPGHSQRAAQEEPAGQMVHESHDSRSQVKIDLDHDPLMTMADKILEDPLQAIGGTGTHVMEVQQGGKNEIVDCEEAGEDAKYTCHLNLLVTIKEELGPLQQGSFSLGGPAIHASYGYLLNHWPRERSRHFVGYIQVDSATLNGFISSQTGIPVTQILSASASPVGGWVKVDHKGYTFDIFQFNYSFQPRIKVPYDSWIDGCAALEKRVDHGLCYYKSKVCTQGPQTRVIQGVPVTRGCWQYTQTYGCSYPSKNDCGPLRARGCAQIKSRCKQRIGNNCVIYTQTYECKDPPRTSYMIKGGKTPFCLDGNCRDQGWENNDEMMSSLAQLAILKELQGQFAMGGFFKGEDNRCSKQPLSFKDCCGSGKGWGNDLGLSSCSSKEKLLNQRRKKGLCHYVGTYCAKKVLGQCVKKDSTYCCWGSKLLKAFHEQGRTQIGMGWGTPKKPLCRGFSIEEIQRIDFSKLDLREVFEDLMKNFNPGKLQGIGQKVGERLEAIKQGVLSPTEKQPLQRKGGA
ncbi:MAG: hypothetical protein BGO67_03955 [Alphaproteobacteria bacterium 41-28]|nr:MAG: hypothetical protein BGO67_03955 [Alphaproteobacteria bacterium 41-28]